MSVEITGRRGQELQRSAQTVAAAAGLGVFVFTLSTDQYVSPRLPLTVAAILLGLGLAGGQALRRFAPTVVALPALAALIWGLSLSQASPRWPLGVIAGLLSLGLVAGPLAQLVSGQSLRRCAPAVGSIAALAVFVFTCSTDRYLSPRWPLAVAAVLLAAGLAASRRAQLVGDQSIRRCAPTIAGVAALAVLVWGLSISQASPRWPLAAMAAIVGFALVAGPLSELVDGQSLRRSAPATASVAAIGVFMFTLSTDAYVSPRWPLTVAAVLLGLGLAAGRSAQLVGGPSMRRAAPTLAAVAGLIVLICGLSLSQATPRWPLTVSTVLLAVGLAAGRLAQRSSEPREQVLSQRVAELSRTRRGALDVQTSELRRIERDLHDGAQARLVALSMKLGRAEERFRQQTGGEEVSAVLREAREDASAAIRELRELARGIAPPVLADRGLEAALRSLADRSGVAVEVSASLARRPMPSVETAAYFVVAESLTNAAKHAAASRVEVRLAEHGGDLFVEVTDFGPGGANASGGGLTGLRQRVEALDGTLTVTSPPGVGTQVEAMLPCGW